MVLIDVHVAADGTVSPSISQGSKVPRCGSASTAPRAPRGDPWRIGRARAALEQAGAAAKIEEVVTAEVRARAPEVAAAVSLKDKLLAHWESKGLVHPRQDGAISRLSVLEGAAS